VRHGGNAQVRCNLVADVVGYSRLAGADEDRTLARLRGLRSDLIDPAIAAHHGRTVKRTGDGLIAEFLSVVDAVRCAIEVQKLASMMLRMRRSQARLSAARRISFAPTNLCGMKPSKFTLDMANSLRRVMVR
jgi:adenylate cyclase